MYGLAGFLATDNMDQLCCTIQTRNENLEIHFIVKVQQYIDTGILYRLQTWNLSKILHHRIFRLKNLHRQFHLISKVLVRKNTKN